VSTYHKKVQFVADLPPPKNIRDLRGFLGLAEYYRKFVRNFGILARPLTDLLKKHSVLCWHQEHDLAFRQLKLALMQTPVLTLPNFNNTFCVKTDASEAGYGRCMQDRHPITYISKHLGI
jgi:hypothetical protein